MELNYKHLLKPIVPNEIKVKYSHYNEIRSFKKNMNYLTDIEKSNIKDLSKHDDLVLFSGYIKSGNTWLRFLIYNYFNILVNNAKITLTYSQLRKLQNARIELDSQNYFDNDFPKLVRTHNHFKKVYDDCFDKMIYIYRNPLDTLVSSYFFNTERDVPRYGNMNNVRDYVSNINHFVLQHLPFWVFHYKSFSNKSDVLRISYEDLKYNTSLSLKNIISYLGYTPYENIIKKSVEISSFESIKKMGRSSNEIYGSGGPQFKGEFTRKGVIGDYENHLNKKTVKKAYSYLKRKGISF